MILLKPVYMAYQPHAHTRIGAPRSFDQPWHVRMRKVTAEE